jgi:rod shape-determining protein MreD
MALPDRVGIFEALLFGLLLDISTGTILGLHAALFVLITYICQRFFYQFRVSPMWQQSVTLFFLFFIFKLAFGFDFNDRAPGLNLSDRNYLLDSFLFALISSLIWTPLFFILREFRRRKIRI